MKVKRTVVGLKEKLPADSDVFLNEQSVNINAQTFFVVIKKFGYYFHISKESLAILILDGRFVRNHSRAFAKVELGDLIKEAWERAATVGLASKSFCGTSMWPVYRNAIPDNDFLSEVNTVTAQDSSTYQNPQSSKPTSGPPQSSKPHPTTTASQLPSTAIHITPTKYSQRSDEPSTSRRAIKALSPLPMLNYLSSSRGRKRGKARELISPDSNSKVKFQKMRSGKSKTALSTEK
ncbi:hypothetical protein PR048_023404 [Dryococelus australis]|uniref:Uncharacterized protein n=1 Tax=Dryococelus australis TaxID=614101 RepID=A0ABQ9GU00_9NEOP|nr:hypothetical protein PR048_023404 [Dryococelus australis]